ncbi:hypothetical protein QVD17_06972 [Tagetes erecta]|uniref:Uncharacterized protein n=1 Tax=Tagetes erecta TaxID=13708 RepID=A0AAD8LF91_TARER|nr:hypothetical protein QVD17_06972 [Tagetes erecta]
MKNIRYRYKPFEAQALLLFVNLTLLTKQLYMNHFCNYVLDGLLGSVNLAKTAGPRRVAEQISSHVF